MREGSPQTAGPVPAPSSLEPLFTALAINRPAEPPAAPDFTLPDLEGRPVRLREFRGKLVFVNFWATWCPPCRLEMPSMARLYQTFKQTAFAMLAVSIDRQGVQAVKPFMEELQLTFPALLDSKTEVARQYGLRGLPMTYLIDRNGWLIGAAVGGRDWSSTEAKALIAGLLRHDLATASGPDQGQPREGR
jgi:peroxiredoxin